ncbi:MAG: hypothetical protein ACP5O3_01430 [Candidatus Micrarchaeia archaeon]|jgi:rRNA maturation protein Rpf1
MSSIYVTTSRKPSQLTRRLARWLELLLAAEYENRGKKSFDEVRERARTLGLKKILFVYERNGNPDRIAVWDADWREPEIRLRSVVFPPKSRVEVPRETKVVAEDEFGEKVAKLLDLREPEGEFVEARVSSKKICFSFNGEEIGPKIFLH